jgi:hypothetical protein
MDASLKVASIPQDGLTRSARLDPDRPVGRRNKGKSSPYAPGYDVDLAPPPVTLPTIDPSRHMVAFRRAMNDAEKAES